MPRTTHLADEDLEEIFARSSGPGGQNVNKVASRVTLRHIPSGVNVTVQDSRSQYENRQTARARLLEAIQRIERDAEASVRQQREKLRRQKSPRPRGLKERILESKRRRARLKQNRGRVDTD
jgi:protein subunit release factor B